MNVTNQEYKKLVLKKETASKNNFKNSVFAFIIGGLICLLGQFITDLATYYNLSKDNATNLSTVFLIFCSALLTGLNLYGKIAYLGGAGTLVPITGFANSVVAPAMEFRTEGMILGLAAKMFIIAGPVIVYGVVFSIIYGIIFYLFNILLW